MRLLLTKTATIGALLIATVPTRADPPARPAPGTTVVDATGALVGYLLSESTIEREITSGVWVMMPGFLAEQLIPQLMTTIYQSTDCTGPAYAYAGDMPVIAEAVPDAKPNTIHVSYAAPPYGYVTFGSVLGGTPQHCDTRTVGPLYSGKVATVQISVTFPLSIK
jgi:hypothetical protein